MRRLFLTESLADEIAITGPDAHHLMHVLRARAGQHFLVVDAEGHMAEAEITAFSEKQVRMRRVADIEANTDSPVELVLAQCLPKADKMDFIVQKAVELGAVSVQPLRSANCVVKYDEAKAAARVGKWQKIADEAAKQCGRTRLLTVEPVRDLKVWLQGALAEERKAGTALLLCYENEQQQEIKAYLRRSGALRFIMIIGPEGGFTPQEAAFASSCGAVSVALGPRILRAETAALAALSVVQYEKGDLGGRCFSKDEAEE